MERTRIKWRATPASRAIRQVAEIEASICALGDEDLLDLADIFAGSRTLLAELAEAEMAKRGIRL